MRSFLTLLGGILLGLAIALYWGGSVDWHGVRDQTGAVVSDTAVTASVRAALALQKDFDLFGGIKVTTSDGVVTLTGTVATDNQRTLAALITRGVEGVKEVVNEIDLREAGSETASQSSPRGP